MSTYDDIVSGRAQAQLAAQPRPMHWEDDRNGSWRAVGGDGVTPPASPMPTQPPPSAGIANATNTTSGAGVAAPKPTMPIDPATGLPRAAAPPSAAMTNTANDPFNGGGGKLSTSPTGQGGGAQGAYGTTAPVTAQPAAAAPGAGAPTVMGNYTPVTVDRTAYDKAAAGYDTAIQTFQSELDRLSGVDPFGNQAFLKQATDRGVGQAAGTAAMARGGGAALAGANRQAIGTQAGLAAQGAQQSEIQRQQDQVTASGQRLTAAGGLATVEGQRAGNETQLAGLQEQAAATNLDSALKAFGINAQVTQQDKDSLRNLASQMAQIDEDRYKTDVAYRESVNTNIINKYASDNTRAAIQAQIKANGSLTPKDVIMGLVGVGTGLAEAGVAKSDRRAKFDVSDPDLRDLQDYLGRTKGKFYRYLEPNKPGRRPGVNFGPMAQDLAKSKIGATVVVTDAEGQLSVDTGRLALADHAALAELARDVAKLKARK